MELNDFTCNLASRARLSKRSRVLFESGEGLFYELARCLCDAECLPRKELFEAWEVCKRVSRRMRGGRVVDMAAGHGLVAWVMLLLDPRSAGALCVDRRKPKSAERVERALLARFPQLEGRVRWVEHDFRKKPFALEPTDRVIAVHACGGLTDKALDAAIDARARVAVLPCCHSHGKQDGGGLGGWVDADLAIDLMRAERLRRAGYRVHTQTIDARITPENRLLFGVPGP